MRGPYLKLVTDTDLPTLHKIAPATYAAYFQNYWEAGGLDWYLEKEYSLERLMADLQEMHVHWFLIQSAEKTVGFAKMHSCTNLPGFPPEEGCELVKMYLLPELKGCGIGKKALLELIGFAKSFSRKSNLNLEVLDTNLSAIAFYEKMGFVFHSNTRLELPFFKEGLRGLNRMFLLLK